MTVWHQQKRWVFFFSLGPLQDTCDLTSGTDVKDGFPDVKGGGHEVVCDVVVVRKDEVVESYACHYH